MILDVLGESLRAVIGSRRGGRTYVDSLRPDDDPEPFRIVYLFIPNQIYPLRTGQSGAGKTTGQAAETTHLGKSREHNSCRSVIFVPGRANIYNVGDCPGVAGRFILVRWDEE